MRIAWITILLFLLLKPAAGWSGGGDRATGPEGEIRQLLADFFASLSPEGEEIELVSTGRIPPGLPSGEGVRYEVRGPDRVTQGGKVAAGVIIRQNGVVVRNFPVQCEVRLWRDALVATRRIEKGTVVAEGDFGPGRVEVQAGSLPRLNDRSAVIGKRTTRTIAAGEGVSPRDLEKVILVKAGQSVMIVAETPVLRLTVPGRAKGNGGAGDPVLVRNESSNRDVMARVIDGKTVQVDF